MLLQYVKGIGIPVNKHIVTFTCHHLVPLCFNYFPSLAQQPYGVLEYSNRWNCKDHPRPVCLLIVNGMTYEDQLMKESHYVPFTFKVMLLNVSFSPL